VRIKLKKILEIHFMDLPKGIIRGALEATT